MNRGSGRRTIFSDDDDRTSFELDLAESFERHGVELHAYCLMSNHFHLLVRCPDAGLSAAMQRFSSVFTRRVNGRRGSDGPLFRGRFRSVSVTSTAQLLQVSRYIHRNVLDISERASMDRYRWSSFGAYAGSRPAPTWLETEPLLELLGGPEGYRAFVERSDELPAA